MKVFFAIEVDAPEEDHQRLEQVLRSVVQGMVESAQGDWSWDVKVTTVQDLEDREAERQERVKKVVAEARERLDALGQAVWPPGEAETES